MGFSRTSERGGIIIWLFIMVAMFAALTYAVTRSFNVSSGAGKIVSEEKMRLAYSNLQSVVQAHRIAIQTMIMKGMPLGNLDVSYTDTEANFYPYTNANCANNTCHLYLPEGGGLRFFKFAKQYPDLALWPDDYETMPSGATKEGVTWTWWSNKGSTKPDLIFSVGVTKVFCEFINKQQGVTAALDTGHPREVSQGFLYGLTATMYPGLPTYDHIYSLTSPDQADHLAGKTEGCFKADGEERYHYVAFLYAT